MSQPTHPLPPGQRVADGFPRFGTHLHKPPPAIPAEPVITIDGAVTEPFTLPVTALADLPREERTADLHCVAGWSATDLRWEGVPFAAFFHEVLAPAARPGAPITHLTFGGLDRYRSIVALEDALAGDVLLAEAAGRAVAALAVDSGRAVADPFVASAGAVAVLRVRAAQLHAGRRPESLLTARRLLLRTASG